MREPGVPGLDENLDETLKETFPVADAFALFPEAPNRPVVLAAAVPGRTVLRRLRGRHGVAGCVLGVLPGHGLEALAITLLNSHQGKSEADAIGIELAVRAGFKPQAAATLRGEVARQDAAPPAVLSTRPPPENRRQRLQALAEKLEPVHRSAKRG
jgi:predicted Zn-dependent protease